MSSACEVDICGVRRHARPATRLSERPARLLDWNNNYGDDPDKAVCFHCSNLPKHFFEEVTMDFQAIIAGTVGKDNTLRCSQKGAGCILFTGATSSVRGGAITFSSAKFAMRGLAQALARELWPKGIHIAHIVVDGVIQESEPDPGAENRTTEPLMNPAAIAEAYWGIVQQDRSAWSLD